jgi:hypothetical protein
LPSSCVTKFDNSIYLGMTTLDTDVSMNMKERGGKEGLVRSSVSVGLFADCVVAVAFETDS